MPMLLSLRLPGWTASLLAFGTFFCSPAHAQAAATGNTYINPKGLVRPTGYTHVVVAADRRSPELLLEIEAVAVLSRPLIPGQ